MSTSQRICISRLAKTFQGFLFPKELEHLEKPYALAAARDRDADRMHPRPHSVALRELLDDGLKRGRGPVLYLRPGFLRRFSTAFSSNG